MKKYAIIVAGGKGLRMNAELPKQFIPINGKPLLMLTLEAFFHYDNEIKVILVLPVPQQEYWHTICQQYGFTLLHQIANGGETRFHSVKNGLTLIPDAEESLIAIHDGVRPFVSQKTISEAFKCAEKYGSAVPTIDPVDSVRKLTDTGSIALDRTTLKMVQTPQVFKNSILKEAYLQEYTPSFTDDASVVEKCGHSIMLTEGNRENIKITTPFDLCIAEANFFYLCTQTIRD
jgi:2-C-methyl-D-erythritol 4-phosphate cytidylyltransferase